MTLICINTSPFIYFQPIKYAVHVSQELWLPEYRCGLQPKHVGAVIPMVQLVGYELVCTVCSVGIFLMRIT